MTGGFIAACLGRGRTVLMVLVLVLVAGTYSYLTIPKEASPDISVPWVYVSMTHEGIAPEDAERMLVRPMENELRGIDGVKEMTATAYEGGANVVLEFQAGMDIDDALNDVREKVDIAKAELPQETEEPTVNEINFALMPVIVVSLSGDIPERELLRLAKDLRDKLEGISQVLEVEIGGDREEVVELVIDPTVLETYDLNLAEISTAAAANNVLIAAGTLDTGSGRLSVKVPGLFESPEDILELPIKTVGDRVIRVADIASVRPTFKDPFGYSRLNGVSALSLQVKKRLGENVIDTVDKVRALIAEEQRSWPEGIEVEYSMDQSNDIKIMLTDLQNNVLSAIILVMIVCIAALGFRSALLVGIAIPGSFLTGLLVLNIMGLTINIVVLFSLILAVGMLVDGAIVVTEFADRKMAEGLPRAEAYLQASKRMAMPIISSTATTLAAFMPLLFWPGVVGEFMKFLPITLIATLSASLAMALIFVPTIGAIYGKPGPADAASMKSLAAAEGGNVFEIHGLTGMYVRSLAGILKHPLKVMAVAIALFVGVVMTYATFGKGTEFFPDVDPSFASLMVRMRGNLSVDEMDELVREVESRVLQMDGLKAVTARSGVGLQGDGITEDTHGLIQIEFKDWRERRPAREILNDILLRTEGLPGVSIQPITTKAGFDASLEVYSDAPVSWNRIDHHLEGLVERVAMIRDLDRYELESGSTLLPGEEEFRLALLKIYPRSPEDGLESLDPAAINEELRALSAQVPEGLRVVLEKPLVMNGDLGVEDYPELSVLSRKRQSLTADYLAVREIADTVQKHKLVRRTEILAWTRLLPENELPFLIGRMHFLYTNQTQADTALLVGELRPLIAGIPGVFVEQQAVEAGPPTGKDIQIEFSSYNPELLDTAAMVVRGHLEEMEGLRDVDDSRPVPGVEWQVTADRAEASRFGANISVVGSYVQFVTNGLMLGTYRPDGADDEIDIRARFPGRNRHLGEIGDLRVTTAAGSVPIRNFVQLRPAAKVGNIDRTDGRRVLSVMANVEDEYLPDTKLREIREWLESVDLPSGLGYRFRGQDEEQQESQAFLGNAFLVALFVMAIILVTQFNSIYQAVLVLSAVVFSTIGVFLGLLMTGQPYGIVMNGIGVIALAGIVVNNNIVLIDTYDHHHRAGSPVMEAVLRTAAQRLRPVMLTTVTTVLGLLPMVLKMNVDLINREVTFNAPSTQWWVQLATSVAFGLVFATLLTLVLTPSLLVLGERLFGPQYLSEAAGHANLNSVDSRK